MSYTFHFERPPIKGSHGLTGCTREERLEIEANRLVVLREKIAAGVRPGPFQPRIFHCHYRSLGARSG